MILHQDVLLHFEWLPNTPFPAAAPQRTDPVTLLLHWVFLGLCFLLLEFGTDGAQGGEEEEGSSPGFSACFGADRASAGAPLLVQRQNPFQA